MVNKKFLFLTVLHIPTNNSNTLLALIQLPVEDPGEDLFDQGLNP
jgi:hypothetical protein